MKKTPHGLDSSEASMQHIFNIYSLAYNLNTTNTFNLIKDSGKRNFNICYFQKKKKNVDFWELWNDDSKESVNRFIEATGQANRFAE